RPSVLWPLVRSSESCTRGVARGRIDCQYLLGVGGGGERAGGGIAFRGLPVGGVGAVHDEERGVPALAGGDRHVEIAAVDARVAAAGAGRVPARAHLDRLGERPGVGGGAERGGLEVARAVRVPGVAGL